MLRRLRPYLPQVVASVILTLLFAVVSSLTILLVMPTFKALFTSGAAGEAASVAGGALDSLRDYGLKARLDRVYGSVEAWLLAGEPVDALHRVVGTVLAILLLKNLLLYFSTVLTDWIGLRLIKDLRDDVYAKFLELPLGFYHRYRAGELISRATNDVQIANKTINVSFTNLVRDPAQILGYVVICLWISVTLTLLALVILPLTFVMIVTVGKHLRRYSHRQQERLADLTSVLQETVYGIRVVKAFAMERFERDRYLRESKRLLREMFKIARMQRLTSPLTEVLSAGVGAVILWFGGREVFVAQSLPPEAFLTFLGALFSMVHPIKELTGVNNGIQEGMAAADRLFEIIDSPGETGDEGVKAELPPVRGRVELRGVDFAYLPTEPVLRGIDLVAEPGEVVALVGSSGAGKSTLVDLIPRFYDPQAGQVLIDGRDVREVTLASLRRSLGIVTQEVILFNDTVRANIAYGLADVSRDRLEAAARAANAHEFIQRLPDGYDTVIGDRGTKLSGGQRQRLSIARAVLKDPPILILDEATSALDTESEQLVQEAIDRLVRNRTTFVIAHRLSTIRSASRIYTLKDGRIVESGTHAELLAAGGVYADLYNLQFRAQETRG
ncbi:MAG TPA: ABC transporter transmembrane domain-containing protein [Candidatus Krumholzibacteria bacterium]|nr:ABC transporter transmembrane domain-containing protein [Candidatus Krumholzibacteria bacterium]HPD72405.1 ABC transporter transmembrane domain-containing protein [Candidatus Krumholzibacteria bacterium]HRY40663.1 ABC transporter transmembrane domain-containing protein [Candidatus Krumholzibacteria bacterium]